MTPGRPHVPQIAPSLAYIRQGLQSNVKAAWQRRRATGINSDFSDPGLEGTSEPLQADAAAKPSTDVEK